MPKKINQLPYFQAKQKPEENILARFLLRKYKSKIKELLPQHYLVQSIPYKKLEFIKEKSKKYPYFLRFDIRLYYPSINHQILLKKLPEIYPVRSLLSNGVNQKISGESISRRFKKYLKNNLPEFLRHSPYGKGLPIGSRLSWVLAGIFLLDLDLEIPRPFLRQTDDYLIFCKSKEAEKLLRNIILPKLKELNLEINEKKLKSGKFYQDKVNFIGFNFYAGYFTISEEKIENFKKKVIKLTWLTRKNPKEAIIKSLNNQILGFGHYYKFGAVKKTFEDLDAFIRMRLRRWLLNQKELLPKEGNLILTIRVLKMMGLKSLADTKERFDLKNKQKIRKTSKNKQKSGRKTKSPNWRELEEIEVKYNQKLILHQLKELTSLAKRMERRIVNLEKKLVTKKDNKKSKTNRNF